MLFKQRDQRPVFTTRQGQNQELLDIIESVYQCYFYVNAINKVFEYYLGQWKLNECKTLCNIPWPWDVQGGKGDGCHPCNKVFLKFWKDDLFLGAETFSGCSFILCESFDMSIVCPSFLTFPWQPLVSCRFGQKLTFLTHVFFSVFFITFQIFTNLYISQAFWLDFVSISAISWLFLEKGKTQDANLRWRVKWRHLTSYDITTNKYGIIL